MEINGMRREKMLLFSCRLEGFIAAYPRFSEMGDTLIAEMSAGA
jgi:hypothetical protein